LSYSLEEICRKLQKKKYKITPQRQIILKTFINNVGKHLSAEEVYKIVKKNNPEIGLATIYRTLDLLAEIDVLQKINFDEGKSRYEFNDDSSHHHHHLICVKCGKVLEFEDDLLESIEKEISKKSNFEILDHKVKFYGYCEDCR
jgi:Fur family ferric uptake transcriptional regulator